MDVSFIAVHDHESGIQRVVKKVVHHFYTMDAAGFEPVAVHLVNSELRVASEWLTAKGLLHPSEADSIEPGRIVAFGPGDILFMLDSSWARYREFLHLHDQVRSAGGIVVTAIYDLLPMQLPPHFIVDGGPAWFKDWVVNGALNNSDAIVTISAAVAAEVRDFIQSEPGLLRRPRVGFWHLGSDIGSQPLRERSQESLRAVDNKPYLLVVGTIEPRKSHQVILSAMELLWAEGSELELRIAGKKGWLVDDLMDRLHGHRELGRRLHLRENPSDDEVTDLYDGAAGLLFVSVGEGFGLPLVEAANHGIPILCSDLPVFREICGDYATYISGREPPKLAQQITAWWKRRRAGQVPATGTMPRLTWEQSAQWLLDVIVNEKWTY